MSLDKDERFTLPSTMEQVRRLAGVDAFDLDAAACDSAHHAARYFTKADNGIEQPWCGAVFVNPPFSELRAWVVKATDEMNGNEQCALIAMVLPENRREQPWWQELIEPVRDNEWRAKWTLATHTLPGRVRFGSPGDPTGKLAGSPNFGTCVLVWRKS